MSDQRLTPRLSRPPQWGGWVKQSMTIDTMKRILANQEDREKRDETITPQAKDPT